MKKNILSSLLIATATLSFACSCAPLSPLTFCHEVQNGFSDIVIRGTVIGKSNHGMQVKVLDLYKGIENRDTLTVWGDPGWMCRYYTSGFSIKDTLILALAQVGTTWTLSPGVQEDSLDYQLPHCSVTFLYFKNGYVNADSTYYTGSFKHRITLSKTSMPYNDFLCKVRLGQDCETTSGDELSPIKFRLFPNPSSDQITLTSENLTDKEITVSIRDGIGREVITHRVNPSKKNISISTSNLPDGMYFLSLGPNSAKKFVVKH